MPVKPEKKAFWQTTSLRDMTRDQWESLCDGCGRCCLHKVEDTETSEIFYTSVACRLLDTDQSRCRHYANRHDHVDDCIELRAEHLGHLGWLPDTCAYRLLDEGKTLPEWHPLVSGDPDSVHKAGISVSGKVQSAVNVSEDEYEEHLVDWVAVGRRSCPDVP